MSAVYVAKYSAELQTRIVCILVYEIIYVFLLEQDNVIVVLVKTSFVCENTFNGIGNFVVFIYIVLLIWWILEIKIFLSST